MVKLIYKDQTTAKRRQHLMYSSNLFFTSETRGWSSHNAAQSCKDIRDSDSSKGDGEYWIDPVRSGNPLKVFCDMTTNGGEV